MSLIFTLDYLIGRFVLIDSSAVGGGASGTFSFADNSGFNFIDGTPINYVS